MWDADFNTRSIDICTSTSGSFVDCGNGRRSVWWDEIINRRTGVRGHISQCFANYER